MSRDSQTDAGRMGAPSQTKLSMATDAKDFTVRTLQELSAEGGLQPGSRPEGAVIMTDDATDLDTY